MGEVLTGGGRGEGAHNRCEVGVAVGKGRGLMATNRDTAITMESKDNICSITSTSDLLFWRAV